MAKAEQGENDLVRAAQALEDELVRLESLSKNIQKIRLDSEKNIGRAAKELAEAIELPERLAAGLGALGGELQRMQARQLAALEPLAARADELKQRRLRLDEHVRAYAELGRATAEATETLQTARPAAVVLESLKAGLAKIAEDAKALFDAARADDFPEVSREADALAKRITHLRRRLETTSN